MSERAAGILVPPAVVAVALAGGRILAQVTSPLLHDRMLPWILGRALGLAAFLALTALVVMGLWFRHPWHRRGRGLRPATTLRAHASLAAAVVVLVAGHVTALALDRYAGVGWVGTFVPGAAHYRPLPVAVGTVALYGLALVVGSAALAGAIGRHAWFPIHRAALAVFSLALLHGATAGSDTSSLRAVYLGCGLLVAVLVTTRAAASLRSRRGAAGRRGSRPVEVHA